MRTILPGNASALLGTVIMPRDFVEIAVKDRSTGALVYERFWSDIFDITVNVIDPTTGATTSRSFYGAAGLVESVDGIPMASDLTVQETEFAFAAYGPDLDRIFRAYDAKGAQVIVWRGFLNTTTLQMAAAAEPILIAEIDAVSLPTGADGSEEYAKVSLLSSQELTRSNPETRSDASQRRRDPSDEFFKYAAAVPDWTMWWGQKKATIDAKVPNAAPPVSAGSGKPHDWGGAGGAQGL